MHKLSEQLEPYKHAAIKCFYSNQNYDFDYTLAECMIVEPGVLKTEERILDEYEILLLLHQGIKRKVEFDDSGILIEYVRVAEFITPLDRDELIVGLMNMVSIRDIEAKYSYTLHLKDKIISELHPMNPIDFCQFTDVNDYLVINHSTMEFEFCGKDSMKKENCDYYNLEQLFTKVSDYNIPERNIFGGFQFHEAPIRYITEEDYAQWRRDHEEYVTDTDFTF